MTTYTWTDDAMRSGSTCDVDKVADNLMHLKYNAAGIQLGSCSTASVTAEKAVVLDNFSLTTGATVLVTFTNANSSTAPTLNVNSTGAKSIASEDGTITSATNPAYFPAGSTVEFVYNGTYWVFKKRAITNYLNGTFWYRVYSDGWIEQGGRVVSGSGTSGTITLLKSFRDVNFYCTSNYETSIPASFQSCLVIASASSILWYKTNTSGDMHWEAKGY